MKSTELYFFQHATWSSSKHPSAFKSSPPIRFSKPQVTRTSQHRGLIDSESNKVWDHSDGECDEPSSKFRHRCAFLMSLKDLHCQVDDAVQVCSRLCLVATYCFVPFHNPTPPKTTQSVIINLWHGCAEGMDEADHVQNTWNNLAVLSIHAYLRYHWSEGRYRSPVNCIEIFEAGLTVWSDFSGVCVNATVADTKSLLAHEKRWSLSLRGQVFGYSWRASEWWIAPDDLTDLLQLNPQSSGVGFVCFCHFHDHQYETTDPLA